MLTSPQLCLFAVFNMADYLIITRFPPPYMLWIWSIQLPPFLPPVSVCICLSSRTTYAASIQSQKDARVLTDQ